MLDQVRDLFRKSICKECEPFEIYFLRCIFVNLDALLHILWEIRIEKCCSVTINGRKTSDLWNGTIYAYPNPLRMKIRNVDGDETTITL